MEMMYNEVLNILKEIDFDAIRPGISRTKLALYDPIYVYPDVYSQKGAPFMSCRMFILKKVRHLSLAACIFSKRCVFCAFSHVYFQKDAFMYIKVSYKMINQQELVRNFGRNIVDA